VVRTFRSDVEITDFNLRIGMNGRNDGLLVFAPHHHVIA
jgi:hypothetical protein